MSKLTNCILNKDSSCVPVWFMRQAGRYFLNLERLDYKIKILLNYV